MSKKDEINVDIEYKGHEVGDESTM